MSDKFIKISDKFVKAIMPKASKLLNLIIISFLAFSYYSCNKDDHNKMVSPNGEIKLEFSLIGGVIGFSQFYKTDTVFSFSPIGLAVNQTDLSRYVNVMSIKKTTKDETWQTVNGKFSEIRNNYNEYTMDCEVQGKLNYQLVIRCYDDGFAYRYHIPVQEGLDTISIEGESTLLNFRDNFTYWAFNGENHNIGPINRQEPNQGILNTPMVVRTGGNHYMAIHEAGIVRYAPFSLFASGIGKSISYNADSTEDKLPVTTSWRTFIIGQRPGDLPESNLLVNLNEPCKIEDTSWIKPGKSIWDWRVWGYKADDGFEYGLNTVSHKRMIDFAAENNIQYLLIDADWYGPEFSENSDPTNAREGVNIEECMAYAKEKNIGVILYLNDVGAKKFGLERVLKQFHEWGAAGVKYGFMQFDRQEDKVRHTRNVVELCAKYELMVDFHDGPIAPSGDHRTWPNLVTKEFGHAQADALKSCYPETFVNQVFINQIAGPLDLTNGWFDLNGAKKSRVKVFEDIPSTLVAEVAKVIAIYSGWIVLPDAPEAYKKYDDLLECIRQMPPQFDSFRVLDGKLDDFVCVARKAGEDWFIGTVNNREAKQVEINMSFLPEGEEFLATFYEDAPNADFIDNKEAYTIRKEKLNSKAILKIHMAAGGGNAIHLKRIHYHE